MVKERLTPIFKKGGVGTKKYPHAKQKIPRQFHELRGIDAEVPV
jgi:mannose-1-phosphate guanylyltransferase